MNRTVTIVIGVLVVLGIFAAAIYFLGSPTKVEPKNKIENIKRGVPSVNKRLDNHESRIKKSEKKNAEQDIRLDKHADAISDLESRINELTNDSSSTPSDSIKTGKKIRKYTKGWDFKDFPENW